MSQSKPNPSADLKRIIDSANRLGIELDEAEALQWLTAMAVEQSGDDVVFDEREGVFGHRVSMLDFSAKDLDHFREIGRLVEFKDVPGKVETALALSGSAAQSKIQTYPGDADYFERVNIIAESKTAACKILGVFDPGQGPGNGQRSQLPDDPGAHGILPPRRHPGREIFSLREDPSNGTSMRFALGRSRCIHQKMPPWSSAGRKLPKTLVGANLIGWSPTWCGMNS